MATNILSLPLVSLTVTTGTNEDWIDSIQFTQDDGITPVDLTGIIFSMEVRRLAGDNDVLIFGSTADGKLLSGGVGESFLLINVPRDIMEQVEARSYVADIVAEADGISRVIIQLVVEVFQGITRRPTPVITS